MLEKAGIAFEFVDAEEMVDLTKKFGIKKSPTLVVNKNGESELLENLSNIKKYVESL